MWDGRILQTGFSLCRLFLEMQKPDYKIQTVIGNGGTIFITWHTSRARSLP